MAITIFYFTFRPTLNLPRIPSGIKLQTMAKKKGHVLILSPEVIVRQDPPILHKHQPMSTKSFRIIPQKRPAEKI